MYKRILIKLIVVLRNIYYGIRSVLWKKDDSCVLIDCWFGQKFADNPRYLFQYLSENKKELGLSHVIWVTHNQNIVEILHSMGYECYMINSKESIRYHKLCKYHIINNEPVGQKNFTGEILGRYSYGSKRINLWHGTGVMKSLGYESNEYKNKLRKHRFLYNIQREIYQNCILVRKFVTILGPWADSYYLTTSNSEKKKIKDSFGLKDDKIIVSGYPRVSYKCRYTSYEEKILNIIRKYKTVILYLPTFRDATNEFNINELENSKTFDLKSKNILFVKKMHSATMSEMKFSLNNNILNIDSNFDITILTPVVNIVITDYSSVLADAMYYRKPVLLYMPDYETYLSEDRGLSSDVNILQSASYKFYDCESIVEFIMDKYQNPEQMKKDNYEEIRSRIWGSTDKNIQEIWMNILEQTN